MRFPILMALAAALVCAIWPQTLLLCLSDGGGFELEPAEAPCCPGDPEDCEDCEDFSSPDGRSAPPGVDLAPPAESSLSTAPNGVEATDFPPLAILLPFPDAELRSVVLTV